MASWTGVSLTERTDGPQRGYFLLPKGSTLPNTGHVLVRREVGANDKLLLKTGLRTDVGTSAWADAQAANALGGEGAKVEYRPAGPVTVLRYSGNARLQLAISLLSALSTVLVGYGTFVSSHASDTPAFVVRTAFAVLVITTILAVLQLIQGINDATG